MINKAIILCGGTGSRMFPVTKSINKQILPLSGKPMFFYPLSLLMLCGVRKFLFIVNKNNKKYLLDKFWLNLAKVIDTNKITDFNSNVIKQLTLIANN